MSISLTPLQYSAAIVPSPTIEMHVPQERVAWNFLASFSGCARGASNRLSVSELIAPPSFGRGARSLVSHGERQFVFDEAQYGLVTDVPSQNLAPGSVVRGSDALSRSPFGGSHTHNQLSHKRDRSPVVFSKVKIMSLELRTKERFAKRLARFVEKERAAIGCAKTAVKNVARKVGLSAVNVYRAMNGYGPVTIKAHHYAALLMLSLGSSKVAAKFRRKTISHPENFLEA